MTTPPLHQEEQFKLLVHLGLFGLGTACALYNLGAWCSTQDCQNRNNTYVYVGLMLYEARQVLFHKRNL